MLKRLTSRHLPPEFVQQRKQGFSIPLGDCLKAGPWCEFIDDVLLDPHSIFDQQTIRSLLKGQDQGRSNSERLFGLVLFELWRRDYGCRSK